MIQHLAQPSLSSAPFGALVVSGLDRARELGLCARLVERKGSHAGVLGIGEAARFASPEEACACVEVVRADAASATDSAVDDAAADLVPVTFAFVPFEGADGQPAFVLPRLWVEDLGDKVRIVEVVPASGSEAAAAPDLGGPDTPDTPSLASLIWPDGPDVAASAPATTYPADPDLQVTAYEEEAVDAWVDRFAQAHAAVESGELDKVVVARTMDVALDAPAPASAAYARLVASPAQGTVLLALDGGTLFAALTPELLFSYAHGRVRSMALAGTWPKTPGQREGGSPTDTAATAADASATGSAATDLDGAALLADPKNLAEHDVVVRFVADALEHSLGTAPEVRGPRLMELPQLYHLESELSAEQPPAFAPEKLMEALSPTPALAGMPRDAALATIAELEPAPRGLFGGACGVFRGTASGEVYVGIRCARFAGARARLWAGCGIVAGSRCAAELVETRAKFQTMLRALGLGAERM